MAEALETSGLDPAGLILEVTESSVMQNVKMTIAELEKVSATGVRIALDDFGEGYSSLGHLRELPIDILKIARPFVRELHRRTTTTPALVRGIIELARSLGLRLVAEGIEYPEQEAILRAFELPAGPGLPVRTAAGSTQLREMLRERQSVRVPRPSPRAAGPPQRPGAAPRSSRPQLGLRARVDVGRQGGELLGHLERAVDHGVGRDASSKAPSRTHSPASTRRLPSASTRAAAVVSSARTTPIARLRIGHADLDLGQPVAALRGGDPVVAAQRPARSRPRSHGP